jgi:hypothetical protein
MRVALRFVLTAGLAYVALAALFAGVCAVAGHSTPEMLYGATATVSLAVAIGLAAAWLAEA